jgi:hypothetical protein
MQTKIDSIALAKIMPSIDGVKALDSTALAMLHYNGING